MRRGWVKYLLGVVLLPFLFGAANPDELRLAKERLQARLEGDKKECAKGLGALLGPWASFVSEVCKARKNLSSLVERTRPKALPEVLVNIFIEELSEGPTKGQYPPMEGYLKVLGEPAVTPLMNRYAEVSEFNKDSVLRTLGQIGSEKALPLVRAEVKRLDLATLSSAVYALRIIRKEAAKEDLLPLLRSPGIDPKAVTVIAQHLTYLEAPGWYDTVLDLAQEGKIPFQTITDLGSYEKYPESVLTEHLDYLLARWASGDSDTVACLLYQIHDRGAVKRWYSILEDLLRAKFLYTEKRYSPLTVRCEPFRRFGRYPLLDRIENALTLPDIEEWMHKPSAGWVSYLYLREFWRKKGGPPLDVEKLTFLLTISVYDEAERILLGEVSDEFQNGVAKEINLQLSHSDDEPYRISLTPQLKRDITKNDRWMIYVPVFMIDLPVGCGFPLEIPMESYAFGKTRDAKGKITRWEVRHIGAPPGK